MVYTSTTLLRRLRPILLTLAGILVFGTVGYMLIGAASLLDAVYMTVITVTTVGFAEVVPLGPGGRIFTILLVLVGVGTFFYAFAVVNEFLFTSAGDLRRRFAMRTIDALRGHYIVCGYGRVGQIAAAAIRESGRTCLVVEQDEAGAGRAEREGFLALQGDATQDDVLRAIRVDTAAGMLVCTGNDADNVFITLSARTLNAGLEVVARASDPANVEKLRRAGAARVVSPYRTGGVHMANSLLRPNVVSFLEDLALSSGVELWLEEFQIPADSPLAGRPLASLELSSRTGATVVGVHRTGAGRSLVAPTDAVLAPGDVVIALGARPQLEAVAAALSGG